MVGSLRVILVLMISHIHQMALTLRCGQWQGHEKSTMHNIFGHRPKSGAFTSQVGYTTFNINLTRSATTNRSCISIYATKIFRVLRPHPLGWEQCLLLEIHCFPTV